ncbi:hypothetical protein M7I_4115 [Glarea lozoyensis 74030]|uniref:Uncharacterized protein n=1 Tax=Glarea lozoyensis (strain ATCC 74030 / MF5533) TaxID=1104152 RepID=H0ENB2_GLAL7|nr:hypothetical protein M7I_4115 [Glarea lozoyensis 74030]
MIMMIMGYQGKFRQMFGLQTKKIDIHNVDPAEFDFEKWLKVMNKDKLINKDKSKKQKPPTISQAYVPINGVVWRFDGLQHQPLSLGQVDEMYGLTQEVLDSVRLSSVSIEIIEQAEGSVEDLMALHQEFFYELGQLRNSYINELAAINYENHQAALKMLEDTAAPEAQAEASTSMVDSDVHMTGGSTTSHTAADTPQDLQHEGEPAETASNGERPENELAAEARPATSTQEGQTNSTTKSGNDEMDLETAIPTSKAAEGSPDVSPVENTSSILSPDHLVQDQPATREERVEDHVAAENKQDDETP